MPAYSLPVFPLLFYFYFNFDSDLVCLGFCRVLGVPVVTLRWVIDPRPGLTGGGSFDSTDSKAAACSNVRTGLIAGWGPGRECSGVWVGTRLLRIWVVVGDPPANGGEKKPRRVLRDGPSLFES